MSTEFEKRLQGFLEETKKKRSDFAEYLAFSFDILGVVQFTWNGFPIKIDLRQYKGDIKKQISLIGDSEINAIWKKGAEMFSKEAN